MVRVVSISINDLVMEHFVNKLFEALSSAWGWLLLFIMFLLDFLTGYKVMVSFVTFAVALDAGWGIASSLKQHKFTLSELGRESFSKLAVYGTVILLFIFIDKTIGINNGLTTGIICAGIILVELWSTLASMLICYPNMPFLQLLKKALVGEIANKLGVQVSDVEKTLAAFKRTKP